MIFNSSGTLSILFFLVGPVLQGLMLMAEPPTAFSDSAENIGCFFLSSFEVAALLTMMVLSLGTASTYRGELLDQAGLIGFLLLGVGILTE